MNLRHPSMVTLDAAQVYFVRCLYQPRLALWQRVGTDFDKEKSVDVPIEDTLIGVGEMILAVRSNGEQLRGIGFQTPCSHAL